MAKLIALDDGHGMQTAGKRTPYIGSLGRSIRENEFNREVVKYLDEELKRCGFRTLLVAPTDADTPLKVRTDLANDKEADAYVSIHYNAFDGRFDGNDPDGLSIHIYPGHRNKEAGKLASSVLNYLKNGTKQNVRGIKENNFHVLRETDMPSILTENGFMDNKREALLMVNVDFQQEVAKEHAQGICDYFGVKYVEKEEKPSSDALYRVQTGAFRNKSNADDLVHDLKSDGFDTYMIKADGLYKVQVGAYSQKENATSMASKLKSHGYPVYITTKSGEAVSVSEPKPKTKSLKVGSKVKVKKGAKTFEGGSLASFVYKRTYEVIQINGNRVVIGEGKTVTAAVHKNSLNVL